jgi:predicted CXXCH cytochrome family protein
MKTKRMARRIAYLILTAGLLALTMSGTAGAAGTHGSWASSDGSCWTCHRAHTATSAGLLTSGLVCRTCHEGALGADTDVINGAYIDTVNTDHSWGDPANKLLGGGFEHISGPSGPAATSSHTIGQAIAPYGSIGGKSITLECTSCHSVHHDFSYPQQYRMLRVQVGDAAGPLSVEWNGPWEGPGQQVRKGGEYMAYTETDFSKQHPGNPIEYTRNYQSGLSAWCSGCHSVYSTAVGPYDIGDGQGPRVRRKHKVDITLIATNRLAGSPATDLPLNDLNDLGRSPEDTMSCITCHRAHGTDTDSTATGAYQVASRGVLPLLKTSMLLRRDNRGVCIDCHGYLNDLQ